MRQTKSLFLQAIIFLSMTSFCYALDCPKELASVFPLCSEAKVLQTTQINEALMTSLQAKGPVETTYAAYKTAAQKDGWAVIMETKQDDAITLLLHKDDRQLVLNAVKEDDGTVLHVTLGKKN